MSEQSNSGLTQPGLTATVSIALISLFTICSPETISSDMRQAASALIAVISPFIVVLLMRTFHKMNIDPDLIRTVSYLERDLEFQNDQLKGKNLPDETRKIIEANQRSTLEKLSTAHQDFYSGKLKARKVR
jgi:hypothetical protein